MCVTVCEDMCADRKKKCHFVGREDSKHKTVPSVLPTVSAMNESMFLLSYQLRNPAETFLIQEIPKLCETPDGTQDSESPPCTLPA